MISDNKRNAFDKLVAGLSSQDRADMLRRLNNTDLETITLVENEDSIPDKSITLHIRYQNEGFFYKFLLWLRSLYERKSPEKIYNDDILYSLAKKVNRDFPGLINYRLNVLDSIFYQRMKELKEAADFFRPFFSEIDENPGEFYVFLSSLVAPEISEKINAQADPFILSFDTEPVPEEKAKLLKNLDNIFTEIDGTIKAKLYSAVISLNWLKKFSVLPFIHFSAQFTNVVGDSFTCPYRNAVIDFEPFAAVFSNIQPIENEYLQSIFLYSNRNTIKNVSNSIDLERSIKEYIGKANSKLAAIQMFISGIPTVKLGKILNSDYDWLPKEMEGVEDWFAKFRMQWREIIDIRWNDWVRERKKSYVAATLYSDFKLNTFPEILVHPWQDLWIKPYFKYELTAGFLSWFATVKYNEISTYLSDVLLEGNFNNNQNRSDYAEGLTNLNASVKRMLQLHEKLSPAGEYGVHFTEYSRVPVRSEQLQAQIRGLMVKVEAEVRDVLEEFTKGTKVIERFLTKLFNAGPKGAYSVLVNFNSIKGRLNHDWRENLKNVHSTIMKSQYYISELNSIDLSVKNS